MLHAAPCGALEVRFASDGAARLAGRFPYGVQTELAPGRLEVFAPGALVPRAEVLLLASHEFAKPLASTRTGSLVITGTGDALAFEARIEPAVAGTSHARDVLALIDAGLVRGLSPGFVVAPNGATVERRGADLVRTIKQAELVELSIVTRPAYPQASVEPRAWQPTEPVVAARLRWRA